MKKILLDKINSWSIERVNIFHQYSKEFPEKYHIWEKTYNGMYMIRDTGCHFFNHTTGVIYKLTNSYEINDWVNHTRLYNLIKKNNDCRIDIPLLHDFFEHNNKIYFYTEIKRPNSEMGVDVVYDMINDNIDSDYIMEYIDNVETISKYLKILYNEYGTKLTSVPKGLTHRLRDSNGYFWKDFKSWDLELPKYTEKLLNEFEFNLLILEHNIGLTNILEFNKIAQDKWRKILC